MIGEPSGLRRTLSIAAAGLLALATLATFPEVALAPAAVVGQWEQISSGYSHTCAIAEGGTAWCWGDDFNSQLGNGSTTTGNQVSPTAVDTSGGRPATYIAISSGPRHTCAIATDGTAWCWGYDDDGNLGNGSTTGDQASPTAVDTTGTLPDTYAAISSGGGTYGYSQTCAIAADGTAWCWGSDVYGRLGNGSTTGNQVSPTAVDTTEALPDTYVAISSGGPHTCAIATGGTAWCWGHDGNGNLGNGSPPTADQVSPTAVDTTGVLPETYVAIFGGGGNTCAIATDATAWCWGNDEYGRLGNGSTLTVDQVSPTAVDTTDALPDTYIASSRSVDAVHACAIATGGAAWCWGYDGDGELGNGSVTTADQASPTAVDTTDALPDTYVAISPGAIHTCAIATDGTAWCWGDDSYGQLGNGTSRKEPASQMSPVEVTPLAGTVTASCSKVISKDKTKIVVKITAPAGSGRTYDRLDWSDPAGGGGSVTAKTGASITVRTTIPGLHDTLRFVARESLSGLLYSAGSARICS